MSSHERIPVTSVTGDAAEESVKLYHKRPRIQVKSMKGRFQRLRTTTIIATMGAYLALPWLNWGERQAIVFDLPAREFHILGYTFWPQDALLLAWSLILLAFALFFVTVLAGRVYCGYVCPQTTWTRFFMWIEHACEGDRHRRLKLDKSRWNLEKIARRGGKHGLWLLLAFLTGLTFVGYFSPIGELTSRLIHWQWGGWELFWVGFFTVATYMNAGFMREQVCLYMCPYARFQSVMFDADTLIVSYDEKRGEPRGRGARKKKHQTNGDCVDCSLCVQVCPTGIDIRDGLQYECITCAACIDACDAVMDRIGKPRGLIRYTTEKALAGGRSRLLRPRLIGYGLVLCIASAAFLATLAGRDTIQLDVLRDRNQLYRLTSKGSIENVYRLEILNKSQQRHRYRLTLQGPAGLTLIAPASFGLEGGQHLSLPVTVGYDPYLHQVSSSPIWFKVTSLDTPTMEVRHESRFIAPER